MNRSTLAKLFGCAERDVDEVVRGDAAARRELTRRGFLGAALALAASPVVSEPENLIQVARTPEIWTDYQFNWLSAYWVGPTKRYLFKFHDSIKQIAERPWEVSP